jgi:hypothetical protein
MDLIPIQVECHSGYKADEYPVCFYWNNERYEIREILDRWYQTDQHPEWPVAEWPVSNYFKVDTAGEVQYIIKHNLDDDEWYLCR